MAKLSPARGNGAPNGGLKIMEASGWFAARPSGTENIYKIYAGSFKDQAHMEVLVKEAQVVVSKTLAGSKG
jgi:phosphoglucomutase